MKIFKTPTIITNTNGILYTEAFKSATRESEKDFTRERRLTFVRCFHLMLSFMTKSLQIFSILKSPQKPLYHETGLPIRVSEAPLFSKGPTTPT